jgi:hypothetical protein
VSGDVRLPEPNEDSEAGITLAFPAGVSGTANRLTFEEPVVLWRMQRGDGATSHAVIGPRSTGAILVWFINGRPLGSRDFGEWTSALRWSDQLQAQNWAVGWRLASE